MISDINVPFCRILSINEVFDHPLAKEMILPNDAIESSKYYLSNVAFEIFDSKRNRRKI